MAIDPKKVCLYVPAELKKFKLDLFNRIGDKIERAGGRTVRGDWRPLIKLPDDITPIIGGAPYLRDTLNGWIERGRNWIYWDRGYVRRVFATWLPRGESGGYYRWHLNCYQMRIIREVPSDRWDAMKTPLQPWQKNPNGHVVVALPTPTYEKFHDIRNWITETLRALPRITERQIVVRDKETHRPLQADLKGAYCLVSHGSVAAVESVICGCPVVVDPSSAAATMGLTDLTRLEHAVYPDREMWVRSLAYSQFNEKELVDGTLWRLIT